MQDLKTRPLKKIKYELFTNLIQYPQRPAYSSKLSIQDKEKIKKAVLSAHKYGEIGGYGGKMSHYMSVKDSDYNILRDVAKLLKKNKS